MTELGGFGIQVMLVVGGGGNLVWYPLFRGATKKDRSMQDLILRERRLFGKRRSSRSALPTRKVYIHSSNGT